MRASQIFAFAIGPAANALLGLATLPLITWLFSPGDVGRLSMLNVAVSFCLLFCSLGLDQAYVREYHSETHRGALLRKALLPGMMVLLLLSLGFMLSPGSLASLVLGERDTFLSLVIMLALISAFLNRFLSLILRMQARGLAYSLGQILPRLTMLALVLGYSLFSSGYTLTFLIVAWSSGVVMTTVILAGSTRDEWKQGGQQLFGKTRQWDMLMFGLPLIPGGLAFWGASTIDRLFVRSYSGFEELALFSVAVSFAGVAGILQTVFTTVWAPVIYQHADAPDSAVAIVTRMTRWMTVIIVSLFSMAGLFSWLVRYLLPAEYSGIEYIIVACLGFPLLLTLSEVTSVGIGLMRKTLLLMIASVLTLLINIALNAALVPAAGAGGAAASTCLSFWIFFVIRTELSVRIWRKTTRYEAYVFTLLCVCSAAMSSLTGKSTENILMWVWGILLLGGLLWHWRFIRTDISTVFLARTGSRQVGG